MNSRMPIKPLKQFGQHFLTDNAIADRIVEAGDIKPGEPIWEIGPGQGVLTERILKLTDHLTAFEIDTRLAALIRSKFGAKLNLLNRDILGVNWPQQLSETAHGDSSKVKLLSNLPYQITSPLLYELEKHSQYFSRIVLMIQKEVAERLTARAGIKAYGVLTLKLGYAFRTSLLFNVPPSAFEPEPKVHSSVVLIEPRTDKPRPKSLDTYYKIIDTAFAQRRKTLRNNLRRMFQPEQMTALESAADLDFTRRGETIDEGEFVRLADCAFDLMRR
jgi:16S rRNA (adenine1518-N6/adenine1519-N6)-dimethyltransferase